MYKSMSKELQNTVNVLKTTSIRPETKSVSVLTDLSNVHLVSYFIGITVCLIHYCNY